MKIEFICPICDEAVKVECEEMKIADVSDIMPITYYELNHEFECPNCFKVFNIRG